MLAEAGACDERRVACVSILVVFVSRARQLDFACAGDLENLLLDHQAAPVEVCHIITESIVFVALIWIRCQIFRVPVPQSAAAIFVDSTEI